MREPAAGSDGVILYDLEEFTVKKWGSLWRGRVAGIDCASAFVRPIGGELARAPARNPEFCAAEHILTRRSWNCPLRVLSAADALARLIPAGKVSKP